MILGAVALADVLISGKLPASFLPEEDYGYAFLNVQLPAAASLARTDQVLKRVEGILGQTEGVQSYVTVGGFSLLTRISASYQGFFFVSFTPWDQRRSKQLAARAIVDRVNGTLATQVPEAVAFAFMPPSIPGLGNAGGFSLWLQDRSGGSVEFLDQNLQRFLAACRKRPELAGVASQFSADVPQIYADVDRDKALRQGVPIADVYQTLQAYLGGLFLNQFNRFGRQWRVFLQAEGAERRSADDIRNYYVRNDKDAMVPLSGVIATRSISGPEYTNRFNLYRAAQVIGGAAPGYSSGQAMAALEAVAKEVLPPEMGYDWADLSYQERRASGTAMRSFGLSLVFVFLILAALYESWSLPFSVLLTVPIAVLGAFIGLLLRGYDLDVYSQIGLIVLVGLSAKNAILVVEFAKTESEKGRDLVDAALEGASRRLRPILMTSFAFILGCVPLWIASGSGAAGRRILGTVVIVGMLAATSLGIFLIPVTFYVVERFSGRSKVKEASGPLVRTGHRRRPGALRMMKRLLVATLAAGLVTGCKVGPNYRRPAVTTPDVFRGSRGHAGRGPHSLADLKWFDVFKDDELQDMIRTALVQNYDLREAVARVDAARANLGIVRADQYPTVDGSGAVTATRFSSGGELPLPQGFPPQRTFGSVAINLVSFEADIWGRLRRATEAARADLLASDDNRKAVVTTLIGDVASAYFNLLELDLELEIARRTLAIREESLQLIRTREQGGIATLLEVREGEQLVYGAAQVIPGTVQQIEQTENAIKLLLGEPPGGITRGRIVVGAGGAAVGPSRIALVSPRTAPRHPAGGGRISSPQTPSSAWPRRPTFPRSA